MKLENTYDSNTKLVLDDCNIPVAVARFNRIEFRLYDTVQVKDDGSGYICPGINHPGIGSIVKIQRDETDYFYGVYMWDSHEFGYMKSSRMTLRIKSDMMIPDTFEF